MWYIVLNMTCSTRLEIFTGPAAKMLRFSSKPICRHSEQVTCTKLTHHPTGRRVIILIIVRACIGCCCCCCCHPTTMHRLPHSSPGPPCRRAAPGYQTARPPACQQGPRAAEATWAARRHHMHASMPACVVNHAVLHHEMVSSRDV